MKPITFSNHYAALGDAFFQRVDPTTVQQPGLIRLNRELAAQLGMDVDSVPDADWAEMFAGNRIPEGAEPLAMAYAGHQFGHFVPQLGDGRAILLGDVEMPGGAVQSIQLKGSGQTAFSRNGDGRAALGPVLREYLLSEAMHALGVPTTRALAAVTTGEEVARERLLPGGVITRVARSFVRVGTFQYFAARGETAQVRNLADHIIETIYPGAADAENEYLALLQQVVTAQAELIARWMQLGFIHGVMNTDNMSVAGETIDYGPCAFIDGYTHHRVFSSIDRNGRYAYSQQPSIGLWNLARLAEALLPLLADDADTAVARAESVLDTYADTYNKAWLAGMRAKLGIITDVEESIQASDKALVDALLDVMDGQAADFTLVFSRLSRLDATPSVQDDALRELFANTRQLDRWLEQWRERLGRQAVTDEVRQQSMQAVNPLVIPRNHQVEAAIRAAEDDGDFSVFNELHDVLAMPFTVPAGKEYYQNPPAPEQEVRHTFCGT
ncbi:MAG: YdiU family protein [Gammaproteobacteria bacterium]|nr:YdiU family protein [Gammaproteobacteria bacterium]